MAGPVPHSDEGQVLDFLLGIVDEESYFLST